MAGQPTDEREVVRATLAQKAVSERGRLEYLLVGLVNRTDGGLAAYPMGKGSGSVTAFSRADGFVRIGRNTEIVDADETVEVTLIARGLAVADLVVIGSHCVGLDAIVSALSREGFRVKVVAVGSQGGLAAARRGECDVAPIHLLDPESGTYNAPFLDASMRLIRGYNRNQGVVTATDETRDTPELVADPTLRMVNRNRGSGTRILIDELLGEVRPPGFAYEPKSHFAVAAAVAQGRADWGVTIDTVARRAGLRFRSLRAEHYDFVVPVDRWDRPGVVALRRLLAAGSAVRASLEEMGFGFDRES
jgi:putative molybdopterin biosynthesis protein